MARLHAPLLFTAALIAAGSFLLFPACGDQCNRSDDCASGEVCYAGVCEQLTRDYVRCASNSDCDMSGRFICRAGRCTIEGVPAVVPADGGDASVDPDGGDAMVSTPADGGDAALPGADGGDAMVIEDAGTSTIGDAGTSTISDAGTSTVTDAG